MNLNTHLALIVLVGILHGIGMYLTVFKRHALSYLFEIVSSDILVKMHMIHLLLQELGMGEFAGHIAIVGEQEHTGGVAVETAHGIDALGTSILHEIHYGLALLRIVAGGDVIFRLVEKHIDFLFKAYGIVVELHLIGAEHFGAQLGNHLTIDRDYTCLDELISLPTRAHSGIGQIFIQTNRLIGIDVFLAILNALFHAVLGIGVVVGRAGTETAGTIVAITAAVVVATTVVIAATIVVAALLTVATLLTAIAATVVVTTLLTTVTTLLTVIVAGLVTTLFGIAGLIAALFIIVAGAIATLRALLAVTAILVVVTGPIAALWALLAIAATVVIAALLPVVVAATVAITALRTIITATLLPVASANGEAGPEAFGAETAFLSIAPVCAVGTGIVNTWTLRASGASVLSRIIVCRLVTFAVALVLGRLFRCSVLEF